MCIIVLSSRIYGRRHPNDKIFVLLTNMGHFLMLVLGDYDYRKQLKLTPSPRYYRQLCPHYHGITADTAVILSSHYRAAH